VLVYDRPSRLLLSWQITADWTYDPQLMTEVEVTFEPAEGGGSKVTLTHSKLEQYGDAAERQAAALSGGWPSLVTAFAQFSDAQ
jgi:uncharacterized protein YndB with AHSA1/START domain